MWRDARLVAAKDLRIEVRTRVLLNQVAPFALLVLLLFAFALDDERTVLARATPGLLWVAVLLSALLAVQRTMGLEAVDGVRDALRLSGLHPAGIFLGKVAAVVVQLLALEVLLVLGVVALYSAQIGSLAIVVPTCVLATVGIASVGCLYGVLAAGQRVAGTLLPLLLLPVLAPLLLAATQALSAAVEGGAADAAPWMGLLALFGAAYLALGLATFGILLDDG